VSKHTNSVQLSADKIRFW